MSSILKALKRLEEQKAVRRDPDHDMEWVGPAGTGRPVGRRRWPIPLALAAVALVSIASTYWLTGRGGDRLSPATPAVERTAPPESGPSSSPVAPSVPQVPVETLVRPSAPQAQPPAVTRTEPSGGTQEVPALEGDGDAPETTVPVRPEPRRAPRPAVPARQADPAPSRPAAVSLPRLSVTGIAWQGEGQVQIAVVNGQSVTEGSTVEGARVERISPDRVSFSFRNRTFDVQLGESSDGR